VRHAQAERTLPRGKPGLNKELWADSGILLKAAGFSILFSPCTEKPGRNSDGFGDY
jgi:hypothetical protein